MTVSKLAPAFLLISGIVLPAIAPARPGEQKPAEPVAPSDDAALAAFVGKHCVSCHGLAHQKGTFRLDTLPAPAAGRPADDWRGVLDRLEGGDMPPKEVKARPDASETERVVKLLRERLGDRSEHALPNKGNLVDHDVLFNRPTGAAPFTPARVWRLSPHNYLPFLDGLTGGPLTRKVGGNNVIRSVVVPFGLTSDSGFRDYAHLYRVSGSETQQLAANARLVVEGMLTKKPRWTPPRPLAAVAEATGAPTAGQIDAAVNHLFVQSLYREPTPEERKRYAGHVAAGIERFGNRDGLVHGLVPVLLHPEAVFRSELGQGEPDEHGRRFLGPTELAVAVAYALTDERPDAALLLAARSGKLATREDVRREVARLLNDDQTDKPRVLRFFQEYFDYHRAPEVFKDEALIKQAGLGRDAGHYQAATLVRDTDLLIEYVLAKDRDVLRELLTTGLSFVGSNKLPDVAARLGKVPNAVKPGSGKPKPGAKPGAVPEGKNPFDDKSPVYKHYNFDVAKWSVRQPLPLPAGQRMGVLTQPSWLIAHSSNADNDAIRRGKWVRERLLGGSIPDTPITVDAKLPDEPDHTLRHRMCVTREAYCWNCHQKMDPLGLPFEAFDHFGRFRTTELGKPVDATGEVVASGDPKLDGKVADALDLIRRLAASERVEQVFVRHTFRYWMGRNETPDDAPTLRAAHKAYKDSNGSMKALILALLTSDSFLYRK